MQSDQGHVCESVCSGDCMLCSRESRERNRATNRLLLGKVIREWREYIERKRGKEDWRAIMIWWAAVPPPHPHFVELSKYLFGFWSPSLLLFLSLSVFPAGGGGTGDGGTGQ